MNEGMANALQDLREGNMVVLVDAHREAEGDVMMAAQKARPEDLAFMLRHARGFICMTLRESRRKELRISRMVPHNTDRFQTPFLVSVGAKTGGSGTSVHDRLQAAKHVMDPATHQDDLTVPGHLHLLSAKDDGVLSRLGHTEAATDLVALAGLSPYAFVCEIMNDDGSMADASQLRAFAETHGLSTVTLEDVVALRKTHVLPVQADAPCCVARVSEAKLPTPFGDFTIYAYRDDVESKTHLALVKKPLGKPVFVRMHSKCVTGDALFSARCDCGPQLEAAYRVISKKGGVILYLDQEGRGIGLENKIKAYALQDGGLDTVEANHQLGLPVDAREYAAAACMLLDLGISSVTLLTNNPLKVRGLEKNGVAVAQRVALETAPTPQNRSYLSTKKSKLDHALTKL
ncbi:GTP cyclohydrolase II [Candidatus Micrarchaeota archaeon]|nr:GTP cyclohydrolase II [Candidatus Micrarchaeota archaeon]